MHPLTSTATAGESRGAIRGTRALTQCTYSSKPSPHSVARGSVSSKGEFDGLLLPRPVHTDGPSHEDGALAWALIIESGHIPLRTRLRYDGLLVPRPTRAAGPSCEERALAWTKIIESGHFTLRASLRTCNHDLNRPLRRRHFQCVQKIIQDLHNVWPSSRRTRA